MSGKNERFSSVKEGFIAGLPVVIGYFPVAMAFGLIAKSINISLLDSFLFSLMVFAGASQFMALDLIKAGVATGNIILATFLLNLRHLMMSASLSIRFDTINKRWLPLVAFGVTDETFSVASLRKGKLDLPFLLILQGISYFAWVSGTVTGYLLGMALPVTVQNSLGIGLYAMFSAILVPEIRKSSRILFLAVISGLIYACIAWLKLLPPGWILIITIIAASGAGLLVFKDDTGEEEG